jgi:hypothetical protein
LFQDLSRGKPLQFLSILSAPMITAICSQFEVHIMRILQSVRVMQRDHPLSLRSLWNQRAPGVSLLSVGRYALHRSITHRMRSMEVGFQFLSIAF